MLAVEEGRDGVTSVTLRANAAEAGNATLGTPSYYTIDWVTVSSRGTKIFCCKYCIANRKLYVLQAQANLDAFDAEEGVRKAVRGIVGSFLTWRGRRMARQAPRKTRESRVDTTDSNSADATEARNNA